MLGLPPGEAGRRPLLDLLRSDASLVPLVRRPGARTHRIRERDLTAGDDEALFFTPLWPLWVGGPSDPGAPNATSILPIGRDMGRIGAVVPTLAFDLAEVAAHGDLAWRPHDPYFAFGAAIEAGPLRGAAERVRKVAECWAVRGARRVGALVRLGALAHQRGRSMVRAAERLLGAEIRRPCNAEVAGWLGDNAPEWTRSFLPQAGFPEIRTSAVAPEVLCYGDVPVRSARFACDPGTAVWHRVLPGGELEQAGWWAREAG
jgi:hypothetical protein